MARRRTLLIMAASFVLASCSNDNSFSDLSCFMEEVHSLPATPPKPLPVFIPYQAFTYASSGERSPFDRPVQVDEVTYGSSADSVRPIAGRERELLEDFSFDSFTMVGTLEDSSGRYALLSVEGQVYRVGVGHYMGRNHGRVVQVTEAAVHILEIVRNGQDAWVHRPRTLTFAGREQAG
ncbi:MAG: pilus assembly protein PilP [Kistimonas sp.]|nr:pilus assembly protein PilP [Kistimonas sp.]